MEGDLLVGQFTVLLQDSATKDLLGGHSLPARIGTMSPYKVSKDEVHYGWRGIEDLGYLFELLHDRASHDRGEEAHLGVEFVPHYGGLAKVISSDTKQLRTHYTMRKQENDNQLLAIGEIF